MTTETHELVIIGGGTAGLTLGALLLQRPDAPRITVIEPASEHYYQPLWTLVGGGVFKREESARKMAEVMPKAVRWMRASVKDLAPEVNEIALSTGETIRYEQLVVAPGIQLDWQKIEGLTDALGKFGVTSNYSYDTVPYTWELISRFQEGRALFTFPSTPIKCAGAPQKIMWLAEESFRKRGVRKRAEVAFYSAGAAIFGVPKYRAALEELVNARAIETHYGMDLVAVRVGSREAVFRDVATGDESVTRYDLLHVTPPQSAPDFIKRSALAQRGPLGWVDVDPHTMQHVRFPNVFSLGDASSLPCSKTGAAIRKQAPILAENILAHRRGHPLAGTYDGYASCPLVTGYGKVILAEFGYDGVIMETFPFDQAKERFSMYALKAHMLPNLYWHGMLQGRA
ncbi:MAG: hypothetical protein RL385_3201 [Pseudomonadota bacterium]|jgi:sulfide:quinone oxidoreductase